MDELSTFTPTPQARDASLQLWDASALKYDVTCDTEPIVRFTLPAYPLSPGQSLIWRFLASLSGYCDTPSLVDIAERVDTDNRAAMRTAAEQVAAVFTA